MGQLAEQTIKVNSTRGVGRVRIDPGSVSGEGGPLDPRLVVPVTVEMDARPREEMLALIRLSGSLHLDNAWNPATRIGLVDSHDLIHNMNYRSLPQGTSSHRVELRFPLTLALVERLEQTRQASPNKEFVAEVHLEGIVAWLRETHGQVPLQGQTIEDTQPAGLWRLGMHSEVSLFWLTDIDPLRVTIDQSSWISNVLPGLGYGQVRLLEIAFPPVPDKERWEKALKHVEQAENHFLHGNDPEVLQSCYAALESLEGAPKAIFDKVSDPQKRDHLNTVLKNTKDFMHAGRHVSREGERVGEFDTDRRDSDFALSQTKIWLVYIARLLAGL